MRSDGWREESPACVLCLRVSLAARDIVGVAVFAMPIVCERGSKSVCIHGFQEAQVSAT